jgi:uncharacterized RDD family membrane protein YckC
MIAAPPWRRLAAITYDAFLVAALWMITTMAVTLAGGIVPIANPQVLMRALLFAVGFGFFGWFWTHGGQTLGMRAWRVRVERLDGSPLRLPTALLRYMAGLLPIVVALYCAARIGWMALPIALAGLIPCWLDARKRALHDFIAGTQMVSAQGAQAQQSDDDEKHRRQPG